MKMQVFIFGLLIAVTNVHAQTSYKKLNYSMETTSVFSNLNGSKSLLPSVLDVGPCGPKPVFEQLKDFVKNGNKVAQVQACNPKNFKENLFSVDYCANAVACKDSTLGNDDKAKKTEELLSDALAKEFLAKQFSDHAKKIEYMEALREFAKDKLNLKLDNTCKTKLAFKQSDQCNGPILDKYFAEHSKSCSFSNGCYKDDEAGGAKQLGYSNFAKNVKKIDKPLAVEYLNYRAKNEATYQAGKDNATVEKLAELATSETFRKASSDQKAVMIYEKMISEDEILSKFDFLDDNKVITPKDVLLKYPKILALFTQKNLSKNSFVKGFNSYREERIKEILKKDGDSCNEIISLQHVCKEVTKLSTSKSDSKVISLDEFLKRLGKKTEVSEKVLTSLKTLTEDAVNEKNIDILLNAKKCIVYNLTKPRPIQVAGSGKSSNYSQSDDEEMRSEVNAAFNKALVPNYWIEDIRGSSGSYSLSDERNSLGSSNKAFDATPEMPSANSLSPQPAVTHENTPNYNPVASQVQQSLAPSAITPDYVPNATSTPSRSVASASSGSVDSSNDSRIDELTKKLAAAEDSIQKMKVSNEEAENERVKQKKIEEEQALINELKTQITDLKSQNSKKLIDRNEASLNNSRSKNSQASEDFVTAPRAEVVQKKVYVNDEYYEPVRRKESDYANEAAAPSAKSATAASSSAGQSSSGSSDKSSSGLGIVLTAVDGMSAEKASETISKRIIELNGMPFYIEESGLVKEIIPVIKDGKPVLDENGKPVFEKITKGKVGDKKFAKVSAPQSRAPAAIIDTADLKRDQEEKLKRERAEYNKLKSLTNEIMNKK